MLLLGCTLGDNRAEKESAVLLRQAENSLCKGGRGGGGL